MLLWYLKFVEDIALLAGSNDEFQELTNLLANSTSIYGIEIYAEKSKLMVNSNVTS